MTGRIERPIRRYSSFTFVPTVLSMLYNCSQRPRTEAADQSVDGTDGAQNDDTAISPDSHVGAPGRGNDGGGARDAGEQRAWRVIGGECGTPASADQRAPLG